MTTPARDRKPADLARAIRRNVIRMINLGSSAHVASCLSIADIMAVLYGRVMNYDATNPKWEGRDRFILSKGHAGAVVYSTLAESGFFATEKLNTHYQDGSDLSGHVSHKGIPGVELSTGSLGHGLSVGCGMALAAKKAKRTNRVFVVLSDGECDEGSNWEAILFASHHKLDNLVAIIDYNKLQSIGSIEDTLGLEPFADKWTSFKWNVVEADGHDYDALEAALSKAPAVAGKPTVVLAHTTKGKGVSFMENNVKWHYYPPKGAEFEQAMKELEG